MDIIIGHRAFNLRVIEMASGKGGRRRGAGRPKGSRNRHNLAMEQLLQERMVELGHTNYDPVVCLAEIALDQNNSVEIRVKAHAEVAQYLRAKRRASTSVTSMPSNPLQMSPDAISRRIKELSELLGENAGAIIHH